MRFACAVDASPHKRHELLSLLPASYRKESGDLAAASQHVTTCVEKELNLQRLSTICGQLWIPGQPMPPRALHPSLPVIAKCTGQGAPVTAVVRNYESIGRSWPLVEPGTFSGYSPYPGFQMFVFSLRDFAMLNARIIRHQ
jgi:hypothetical protein